MALGVPLLEYFPLDPIAYLRYKTSINLTLWYAGWKRMEPLSDPTNTLWPFPFTPQDWAQTPLAVQAYVRALRDEVKQLHDGVETLEARLQQNSTTSSRPPSSDSPYKKPRLRPTAATPRKAGGKPGHPGHRQVLLPPTTVREVRPERCACGNTTLTLLRPYYTHQVLELPPIEMEVTHWVLHQGWCPECGCWKKAQVPTEHATGGRVSDLYLLVSNEKLKLIPIDKQPNNNVMHLRRFGEANRLACETLDPGAQGQMLALDLLRVLLAWIVLRSVEMPCVGAPIVRMISTDAKRLQ
jgi:Family of unknown function (DUF6444)/zinc-finger binding domain of transposase IS66